MRIFQVVEQEQIQLPYIPGNVVRLKVMVVGDLDWELSATEGAKHVGHILKLSAGE